MTDLMPGPQRYRKKPVVVEAMRVPLDPRTDDGIIGFGAIAGWLGAHEFEGFGIVAGPEGIIGYAIDTLEGEMLAGLGDWVVRGVEGEFYPIKHRIFAATYDEVE